jgi:hypothetical protein
MGRLRSRSRTMSGIQESQYFGLQTLEENCAHTGRMCEHHSGPSLEVPVSYRNYRRASDRIWMPLTGAAFHIH